MVIGCHSIQVGRSRMNGLAKPRRPEAENSARAGGRRSSIAVARNRSRCRATRPGSDERLPQERRNAGTQERRNAGRGWPHGARGTLDGVGVRIAHRTRVGSCIHSAPSRWARLRTVGLLPRVLSVQRQLGSRLRSIPQSGTGGPLWILRHVLWASPDCGIKGVAIIRYRPQ